MKALLSLAVLFLTFTIAAESEAASCVAKQRNRHGDVIRTFHGYGWDKREACADARRSCKRVVNNNRRPADYCTVEKRRGHRYQTVTRTCSVSLYGKRGRFLRQFTARATGYRGYGVKAKACQKARMRCQRQAVRRQYCQ